MQPSTRSPWIFRAAVGLSLLSAALFVLTMIEPQWIEWLFDESPDGGDGSVERLIVGACCAAASVCAGAVALRERRRASPVR